VSVRRPQDVLPSYVANDVLIFIVVHRRYEVGGRQRLFWTFWATRFPKRRSIRLIRSYIVETSRKGSQRVNSVIRSSSFRGKGKGKGQTSDGLT
jgi:hypothetical protein